MAKKNSSLSATIRNLAASLVVFITATIIVTDTLQERIYFSLFVGIPAGLVAGILVFIFLTARQKTEK